MTFSETEHTTLASWALAIERAVQKQAIDIAPLYQRSGIDRTLLSEPEARILTTDMWKLWHVAVDMSGDDAFGLYVAQSIFPTHLNALVFALQASANLQECVERLIRYSRVVSTIGQIEYEKNNDQVIVRLNAPAMKQGPWAPIDAFMALIVKFVRDLLSPDMLTQVSELGSKQKLLHGVKLVRPQPKNEKAFEQYFNCSIDYSAENNEIIADAAIFDMPLPSANSTIANVNDQLLQDYLNKLDQQSFSLVVRKHIIEQLGSELLNQESIAEPLNISGRTLQRKLAEEGTSFKELLDDVRQELALRYLTASDMSISELTFMLGFVDQSSFSRAFKRWTGQTPSQYRKSK